MATTKGTSDGPKRQIQITPQRRGAGIILGIFTILFLMGTGAARRAQAQTYIVLHSFSGSDGAFPYAGLVRDSHGNLYGTTAEGGASTNCSNLDGTTGCGTVFKLDTSGTLTVLHSFDYSEGANPYGALVMDPSKGTLYGTTAEGGTSTNCSNLDGTTGCGTVFKLDTSGTLTVLHSFDK
ncbi:MAG TPA: choice-of-anchor tandem repeat GloVer-containing protein, partial [Terriglobia bacterium]|nr:choice-of-anchor tandem repeat GloVer-containing protein [Terriglobia bacterium]